MARLLNGCVAISFLLLLPAVGAFVGPAAGFDVEACRAIGASLRANPIPPGFVFDRLTIVADDGARLDAGVYRPAGATNVPIVMDVGPYFGSTAAPIGTGFSGTDGSLVDLLAPEGYAFAVASLRGTGCSEGCFSMGDARERADLREIVDAVGALPWSNGKVAMIGLSYDGTTPWEAAVAAPEHLATIVPLEGITDHYRYVFRNGTTYAYANQASAAFTTYYPVIVDWGVGTSAQWFVAVDPVAQAPLNLIRTCNEEVGLAAGSLATTASGTHDAFWDERSVEARLADIRVPVFAGVGLQDWNVKPDNALSVLGQLQVPTKAWIGQWDHKVPNRDAWESTLLAWLDRWLKDAPNGIEAGPSVSYEVEGGAWRDTTAWPPPEASAQPLRLTAEGALATDGSASPASVALGPSVTLAFVSEPAASATTVAGVPRLDLTITPSTPGGHLYADLSVLRADGGEDAIGWAPLDVAHARTIHERDCVEPGVPIRVALEFFPLARAIQPGDRLRLRLSTESDRILPSPIAGAYEIALGGEDGATLQLPVVP